MEESTAYKVACIRFAMKSTSYKRFETTVIAQNISERSLAYVNEHYNELINEVNRVYGILTQYKAMV